MATTTKKTPAKPLTLAQAAAKGEVRFLHQRANGTLRRLPYLAPGTPERKRAEHVAQRREKGQTIDAIAGDQKLSKATVRRLLSGLMLARAVEAGTHDKAWDGTAGAKIVLTATGTDG